jgi:hypothetical protein
VKKTDFDKLTVGQRVTVTGTQDGEAFNADAGVVVASPSWAEPNVRTINFDTWRKGWGPDDKSWSFEPAEVRKFTITVIPEAPKAEPKPRKAPKGAQAYKGNGKHSWEQSSDQTYRLRVPGGWLYGTKLDGYGASRVRDIVFVPVPQVVGYAV